MGIGQNTGCEYGVLVGSTGRGNGAKPIISSISAAAGSSDITVYFNYAVDHEGVDLITGMAATINSVPITLLTQTGDGSTKTIVITTDATFSGSDDLNLTYTAASGAVIGRVTAVLMEDQSVSTTIAASSGVYLPSLVRIIAAPAANWADVGTEYNATTVLAGGYGNWTVIHRKGGIVDGSSLTAPPSNGKCMRVDAVYNDTDVGTDTFFSAVDITGNNKIITMQFKTYFPAGYDFTTTGGLKFWRPQSGEEHTIKYDGGGSWHSEEQGYFNIQGIVDFPIVADQWTTWTCQIAYSSSYSQANAYMKFWGQNTGDATPTLIIHVNSAATNANGNANYVNRYSATGFTGAKFISFWNLDTPTAGFGSPANQSCYIHDVYITDESDTPFPFTGGFPDRIDGQL